MHATFASYLGNPLAFAAAFAHRMFKNERATEADVQWIVGELAKTPPWIAIAVSPAGVAVAQGERRLASKAASCSGVASAWWRALNSV